MTNRPDVGTPEPRGPGWFVPSAHMPEFGYYVEISADTVRCCCPSFVWRRSTLPGGECKRIKAVRKAVLMGDT
jgi:hypothetical protein